MRLFELTPYRNSPVYNIYKNAKYESDLTRELIKNGYLPREDIGLGTYGRVFKRPSDNYVIKIFGEDHGYLAYLKYIKSNQSNPHVPKIRGKLIHPFKDKPIYVVRLEVLNAPQTSEQKKIDDMVRRWSFGEITLRQLEDKIGWPRLIDTLYDIRRISKTNKPTVVLDVNEVMFRGSSPVPVINDPLWFDDLSDG